MDGAVYRLGVALHDLKDPSRVSAWLMNGYG